MKTIHTQIRKAKDCPPGAWVFLPKYDEDRESIGNYKEFQIVKQNTFGVRKPRSLEQLNTFFKVCTILSEIAGDMGEESWDNKEKVAFQVKVGLQFIDASKTIVGSDGKVHLHYRSISFKSLAHMEACNFFNRAYQWLDKTICKHIGTTMAEIFESINLVYDPRI